MLIALRDYILSREYTGLFMVFRPFLYGFVIAYLLNPLMMLFENKVFGKWKIKGKRMVKRGEAKLKRLASVIATFVTAIIVVVLLSWMVFPQINLSIRQLTVKLVELFSPAEEIIEVVVEDENQTGYDVLMETNIGAYISDAAASVQHFVSRFGINMDVENSFRELALSGASFAAEFISEYFETIVNTTAVFIFSTARQIFNILLGIVAAFYILLDKEKLIRQFRQLFSALLPAGFINKTVTVASKIHTIFGGFIRAKAFESVIVGLICFVCLSVMRIEYTMLITAIVGITNIIPFFGPFIGAIPSIFILLTYDPAQALWFAIFILILQQIDGNFIGPKIIGSRIGISSFWVIFAIMVMTGIMGPLGMFIGVPTFTVIYALVKDFTAERLNKKGVAQYVKEQAVPTPPPQPEAEQNKKEAEEAEAMLDAHIKNLMEKLSQNVRAQAGIERETENENES